MTTSSLKQIQRPGYSGHYHRLPAITTPARCPMCSQDGKKPIDFAIRPEIKAMFQPQC